MSTNASDAHFFMDYRDDRLVPYDYSILPPNSQNVDHWIKYDFSTNTFYYSPINRFGPYTEITKGDYIKFWDLYPTNPAIPSTSEFPNYWENCLAIIPSLNNHALVVWGPYPGDQTITEVTYYEIWRKYGSGTWTYLDYVGGSTFS